MTYDQFNTIVLASKRPVILVEGIRDLPEQDAGLLTGFASWLAETYPHDIFRTENADGSDTAFARGVAAVDPTRLEYVLPYGGHKKHSVASYLIAIADQKLLFEHLLPKQYLKTRSFPLRFFNNPQLVVGNEA
jgi:hypothetical protein